jgi:hypothetical protein
LTCLKRLHLALGIAFAQTLQNGIGPCFEALEVPQLSSIERFAFSERGTAFVLAPTEMPE